MTERPKPRTDPAGMFAEGVALVGIGVTETIRNEIPKALFWGVAGAAWGSGVAALLNRDMGETMWKYAKKGARFGAILGWQIAPATYNKLARREGLPKVGWGDGIVANIVAFRAYDGKSPFHQTTDRGRFVATQFFNPITMRGMRRIAESFLASVGK